MPLLDGLRKLTPAELAKIREQGYQAPHHQQDHPPLVGPAAPTVISAREEAGPGSVGEVAAGGMVPLAQAAEGQCEK
jgi:hypothetical protein